MTDSQPKQVLYVMRLADMHRVHPQMDSSQLCERCEHRVGIYPSGQNAIKERGRNRIEIVCSRCETPRAGSVLAPGALAERSQSVPR